MHCDGDGIVNDDDGSGPVTRTELEQFVRQNGPIIFCRRRGARSRVHLICSNDWHCRWVAWQSFPKRWLRRWQQRRRRRCPSARVAPSATIVRGAGGGWRRGLSVSRMEEELSSASRSSRDDAHEQKTNAEKATMRGGLLQDLGGGAVLYGSRR